MRSASTYRNAGGNGAWLVDNGFFGALESGTIYMRLKSGTPAGLVSAMEGLVLLFFLSAAVATRLQIVRREVHA
ncbi:hypothetical protein NKJ06_23565 [Mesorhizobium sp. M0293]|uniref:hypothetical protein n=1 Tax=unclassified Mesorhizobium TaxID=325217 RepID=UPI00333D9777